jgi:hydrogenase maturation protease
MAKKPVLVLGVGNILYGDDGIGSEVINVLSQTISDPGIELIDGGVGGYGLIDYLDGREKVIIIDAVNMEMQAGTCREFAPDDVSLVERLKPVSLHDTNVLDVVNLARSVYQMPEIRFVGIQPARVAQGIGLSEELQAKKEEIVGCVQRIIARESKGL